MVCLCLLRCYVLVCGRLVWLSTILYILSFCTGLYGFLGMVFCGVCFCVVLFLFVCFFSLPFFSVSSSFFFLSLSLSSLFLALSFFLLFLLLHQSLTASVRINASEQELRSAKCRDIFLIYCLFIGPLLSDRIPIQFIPC